VTPEDARQLLDDAEREVEKRTNAPKFPCPKCGEWSSLVKDGRPAMDGYRRKRRCASCGHGFFTMEKISHVA